MLCAVGITCHDSGTVRRLNEKMLLLQLLQPLQLLWILGEMKEVSAWCSGAWLMTILENFDVRFFGCSFSFASQNPSDTC